MKNKYPFVFEEIKEIRSYHRQMKTILLDSGASSDEIEELRSSCRDLVRSIVAYEREIRPILEELLFFLSKVGDERVEKQLRSKFFLIGNSTGKHILQFDSRSIAYAMNDAWRELFEIKSKADPAFKKFNKNLKKIKKHLDGLCEMFQDEDIQLIYAQDLLHKRFAVATIHEQARIDLLLGNEKAKKGRPQLTALYSLVLMLALAYEDMSGDKFTVLRCAGDSIGDPVTSGHRFVHKIVTSLDLLTGRGENPSSQSYSDKNIYNACEDARTKMNKV